MATGFCPVSIFALSLLSSFLHFNKLLFGALLPHCLIGMQGGNVLVSGTTRRPFTYTICLTLLPFPCAMGSWQTRVYDVQTCTLKQSNGSAFIGIKFLTAVFFFSAGGL